MSKQKDYEVAKCFLQTLIYPSILGTFLMDIIDRSTEVIKEGIGDYFSNITTLSIEKNLLIFGIVFFFCCDFLYSSVTKTYKKQFIAFDTVVILCLLVSFNAINISTGRTPNFVTIAVCLLIFMIMFLIWDKYLITKEKENLNGDETRFYKHFMWWESIVTILLLLCLSWYFFLGLSTKIATVTVAIITIASSTFYLTKLPRKRRFELIRARKETAAPNQDAKYELNEIQISALKREIKDEVKNENKLPSNDQLIKILEPHLVKIVEGEILKTRMQSPATDKKETE